jgi:GAF domain-containing protein
MSIAATLLTRWLRVQGRDSKTAKRSRFIFQGFVYPTIHPQTSSCLPTDYLNQAIQSFGALIALNITPDHRFVVRIASENTGALCHYSPAALFQLDNFLDILQSFYRPEFEARARRVRHAYSETSTASQPQIFTTAIVLPEGTVLAISCAMHWVGESRDLLICEFESEEHMHIPSLNDIIPEDPVNSFASNGVVANTTSQPKLDMLDHLRSPIGGRRKEGAELVMVIAHIQTQLSAAKTIEGLADTVVALIQDLTKFHRVMLYRFDHDFNGAVIAEIANSRASGTYKGLRFPASDIPAQARKLYQINRVRLLFDREQETSRLVCRTVQDLQPALDLTYSYLRAMSPIHLKYLANMGVRSTMSISLQLQGKLWGLVCCHSYGPIPLNVSFQVREVCHWIGLCASDCLEKITYSLRLQSRLVLDVLHTSSNPQSCVTASAVDILRLFDARSGFMVIQGEARSIGRHSAYQEAILLLRYINSQHYGAALACSNVAAEHPIVGDKLKSVAGFLAIPLSSQSKDFLLLLRDHQAREVNWAGCPHISGDSASTRDRLAPRESFQKWRENVHGFSKEWTDEQIHELAPMIRLVYGNFIHVWRQRERAVAQSRMKRALLRNASHDGQWSSLSSLRLH